MSEKPRAADPARPGSASGGAAPAGAPSAEPTERVVVRDKRKIDTGKGKAAASSAGQANSSGGRAGSSASQPARPAKPAASGQPRSSAAAPASGPTAGEPASKEPRRGKPEVTTPDQPEQTVTAPSPPESTGPAATAGEVDKSIPADESGAVAPGESGDTAGTEEGAAVDAPDAVVGAIDAEALRAELDERTRDLQRLSAEYANYRKRVDRDRGLAAEQTIGVVLAGLLPVLDDLDRARDHGDLVGPFGAVAEQLTTALAKFGLTPFGEKGDPFDPTRHEAVAHLTSLEVTKSTCIDVMRRGYLLGDRLLRPALVAVADPA